MTPLPWYYLGDIATTLYRGLSTARTDCKGIVTAEDVQAALNSSHTAPHDGGDHPAVAQVRKVERVYRDSGRRKDWATWGEWPETFTVKVRSDVSRELPLASGRTVERAPHEYILGPRHLVLPWPFNEEDYPDTKANRGRFRVKKWDPEDDYDPKTDVLGDLLLAAGDHLVDPPGGGDPETTPGDPDVRRKLIAKAVSLDSKGFYLPRSVYVYACDVHPLDTHLLLGRGSFALVLGANKRKRPERVGYKGVPDDGAGFFSRYPCGGFGSEK